MLLLYTSNCLLIHVHRGFPSLFLKYFKRGGKESGLEGLLKEIGFKSLGEKNASNEGKEEKE